jgi:GDPmannose 4,6-dehydratase
LIIGAEGQDGTYLRQLLGEKGYRAVGVGRRSASSSAAGDFHCVDVRNRDQIVSLIRSVRPNELYYLAAFHGSSENSVMASEDSVRNMLEVNTLGLDNVLSGIASAHPQCRVFYAASSLVFGDPPCSPQNEATPMNPICPYGISKLAGIQLCRYYSSACNIYASVGVLYNHESPLRPPTFISRKITQTAARISKGKVETLAIGNLEACVDWGYAPDYVRAMYEILHSDGPDLFVVGSGVLHTIRDFVKVAFESVGLDWREHVVQDQRVLRRKGSRNSLCADPAKLRNQTGWRPRVSFEQMVQLMVDADRQAEKLDSSRSWSRPQRHNPEIEEQ